MFPLSLEKTSLRGNFVYGKRNNGKGRNQERDSRERRNPFSPPAPGCVEMGTFLPTWVPALWAIY